MVSSDVFSKFGYDDGEERGDRRHRDVLTIALGARLLGIECREVSGGWHNDRLSVGPWDATEEERERLEKLLLEFTRDFLWEKVEAMQDVAYDWLYHLSSPSPG